MISYTAKKVSIEDEIRFLKEHEKGETTFNKIYYMTNNFMLYEKKLKKVVHFKTRI
jgi:hypothetical protein